MSSGPTATEAHRPIPLALQPFDRDAVRRRRQTDVADEGAGLQFHAARLQPGGQGFDERLVLADRRTQDVLHVREVGEQAEGAVDVAPELGRAVLRQRPHDGRPEQPELGLEEIGGEELLDPAPVQQRFRRQRELHEIEPVAQAQSVMRPVHDLAVAVDDVRSVMERVLGVEGKELVLDRHRGIAGRRNVRQQVERAAELGVEHGAGQVVAALRVPAEEEAAARPRFRLVDRDVRAGHACVPDEICGCGQSAEPTADDMRLHRPPLRLPVSAARRQYSQTMRSCHVTCVTVATTASGWPDRPPASLDRGQLRRLARRSVGSIAVASPAQDSTIDLSRMDTQKTGTVGGCCGS